MEALMLRKLLSSLSVVGLLTAPAVVAAGEVQSGSAHQFTFPAIDGSQMPLANYAGKVMLVVNTASFCGFTKQYAGLQSIWERYEAQGFVVIGVPSNDFGEQEPGSAAEIQQFCQGAFGVTFPLAGKQTVKGPGAHPFYQWARAALGERAAPRWNFHKYLVGRDGKLIAGYGSTVAPDSEQMIGAIEAALAKPAT
jgi:glutathione peroxidase